MGSGTSLIEAQRMGRNSIGIEIQHDVAKEAYDRINTEKMMLQEQRLWLLIVKHVI